MNPITNISTLYITLLLSVLAISSTSYSQDELPILEGPLMGQKPPGLVAEPFAPGIISKEGWELEGVFAPGMKEIYFTSNREKATVTGFRQKNNVWNKYLNFVELVKLYSRLMASACIWQKAIKTEWEMAGQN
jgi:hypothetical protein